VENEGILLSVSSNRDLRAFVSALNRAIEISRKAGKS